MADEISVKKITELTSSTEADDNDLLAVGDSDGVLKKMTVKSFTDSTKENIIGDTDISNIADGTVTGAVSELNTRKSNTLYVQRFILDNLTVDANSQTSFSLAVSLDGYTPLCVCGFSAGNASEGGTYGSYICFTNVRLNDTSIDWSVRNYNSSTAKIRLFADVLFVKD